jgi:hypothetical protein
MSTKEREGVRLSTDPHVSDSSEDNEFLDKHSEKTSIDNFANREKDGQSQSEIDVDKSNEYLRYEKQAWFVCCT